MILRFFCLHDSKMNLFMNPMPFQSAGQAIRAVTDEANRPVSGAEPPTTLQSHPEDLTLYEVGEWDNETGKFHGHSEPQLISKCAALVVRSS